MGYQSQSAKFLRQNRETIMKEGPQAEVLLIFPTFYVTKIQNYNNCNRGSIKVFLQNSKKLMKNSLGPKRSVYFCHYPLHYHLHTEAKSV